MTSGRGALAGRGSEHPLLIVRHDLLLKLLEQPTDQVWMEGVVVYDLLGGGIAAHGSGLDKNVGVNPCISLHCAE